MVSALSLIGLTVASLVMYRPVTNDMKNEYVSVSATLTYNQQFERYLDTASNARVLLEEDVQYESVFTQYPQMISFTTVPDSSKSDFERVSRKFNSSEILAIDHSANCMFSLTAVCDPNYINTDIRDSQWFRLGSELSGSSNATWDGPYAIVNPLTNQVANTISLIWKSGNETTFSVSTLVINMGYFELAQNPLLDNNGTERVWIINSLNETVVAALGVDMYSYLSITLSPTGSVSVSPLPLSNITSSLVDGQWLSDLISIPSWISSSVLSGLSGDVSAGISTVSGTIFTIIVASNSIPFYDKTFVGLFIAEIIVSIIPIFATILVLCGYWLRIESIKRTKQRRKIELLDAQTAIESTRSGKLNSSVIELTEIERRSLADLRRDATTKSQVSSGKY